MLFIAMLSVARGSFAADDSPLSRNCALGDAAFLQKDYTQAALFYNKYKQESNGKDGELQDAYIRLISSYIRDSKGVEAERELAEFEKTLPNADSTTKTLYRAEILLLQHKYADAEELLRQTLNHKVISGQLYFQILSSLGFALLQQSKWEDAVKVYALLEKSAVKTPWEFIGFRQKLYALIMGGGLQESRELLTQAEKYEKNPDYSDIKLLSLLQMVQEKKFSELKKAYPEITESLPEGPDALLYSIDLMAAKHCLANNAGSDAIPFLKDAFKFAPSSAERKNALRNLINAYVDIGLKKDAIAAALKYIEFYAKSSETVNVKFECARLMMEMKMDHDALAIYSAIMKETGLGINYRIEAAREAAKIYELLGKYEDSARMLLFIYENSKTPEAQNGSQLELGMLYYRRQDFHKAAQYLVALSAKPGKWQSASRIWAIQALVKIAEYKQAQTIAEALVKDKTAPQFAEMAEYFNALLLEKTGKNDDALKAYLQFVKNYPKNEYAPVALFDAGNISFKNHDFARAASIFTSFSVLYPKNQLAANALYKGLYARYFLKDAKSMKEITVQMEQKYPESPFTVAAMFWQVDYLKGEAKYSEALELLRIMAEKYQKNQEISPKIIYDMALINQRQNENRAALALLENIFEKYPQSSVVADGLFLAGDIASVEGDYSRAAAYYQRAAKLRPGSDFSTACYGRVADCNYSLYCRNFDTKYIKAAVEGYQELLKLKKIEPAVRNQSLFKLGLCYEMMNDEAKALTCYNELIYGYEIDLKKGVVLKPLWTIKAAHAAIIIYVKRGTPESAAAAIKIYQMLKSMDLKTGEDFDKFIDNIKSKYKI